jgi:hypothetical protein
MKTYMIFSYDGKSYLPDGKIETKNAQILYRQIQADSPEGAVEAALDINPKIADEYDWVEAIEILGRPTALNLKDNDLR